MNKTRKNKTKILVTLSLATTMILALSVPINAQEATPLQNFPVAQSATVGTTFQSDGFTFTVISDGKVRIKSLNGKQVSQSADADTLQLDTVEHDGETYAITEIEYLDLTGYKKFVMNNLEVFNGQTSISWADVKEVSMPSVTSLGEGAFANSKVEKVTCDSLITVGQNAFNGAKYLKEGNFPKVTTIEERGLNVNALDTGVLINESNFPDEGFRDSIKKFDWNNDNILSDEELNSVKRMNLRGNQIKSIVGIEHFSSMTELDITNTSIETFDYKNLPNSLKKLVFMNNQLLSGINLANNQSVTYIDFSYQNPQLKNLDFRGSKVKQHIIVNQETVYISAGMTKIYWLPYCTKAYW